MPLGHRQLVRLAVDLPRAGEDHLRARIVMTARLEQRQLAAAVDVEIGVRVAHAVDVADLAGEVENHVAALHQVIHRARLPHIGDVDRHLVFNAGDVEQVAAVLGNQRVDEQHVGAELHEPVREVAADETETAGDHHAPAAIEGRRRSSALEVFLADHEQPPQFHHVNHRLIDSRKVEELRLAVSAMIVMNRMLRNAKPGVLELLHHLQADDAAVLLQADDVEDAAPHQAEIAVDVAHLQAEQQLDDVVIDAADDDAVQRVGLG